MEIKKTSIEKLENNKIVKNFYHYLEGEDENILELITEELKKLKIYFTLTRYKTNYLNYGLSGDDYSIELVEELDASQKAQINRALQEYFEKEKQNELKYLHEELERIEKRIKSRNEEIRMFKLNMQIFNN